MQSKAIEMAVGLFVLAGILALGMLALRIGNLNTTEIQGGYTVYGRFINVGGLNVKAPVTMAGVRIGRVTGIHVDPGDFNAVVAMRIEKGFDNIPRDTAASILTAGLLGAQYVGLEPGGSDEFLQDGDEFDLTQSAVILEQLIGQLIFSQSEGGGQ